MTVGVLDHLVLTVADIEASLRFYTQVLGMRSEAFGVGRSALHFGAQKINLHLAGAEFAPHASRPTPGSADLCFVAAAPLTETLGHLKAIGIALEDGPVARTGACGPITSVYFRDPDGNLIELAHY
ncbi:MAG: VOC family protein [Hydrogenophilales bacterium]|nr:VOC family protein [Hydrogenophilales bacterium]